MIGFDMANPSPVLFEIRVDDSARFPAPSPDENGLEFYTALISLPSWSRYQSLKAYHSTVDIIPAMQGGGLVTVRRGRGVRQLTYPRTLSIEMTVYAILTELSVDTYIHGPEQVWAEATWVILGEVDT
jgi:hypothetical protein